MPCKVQVQVELAAIAITIIITAVAVTAVYCGAPVGWCFFMMVVRVF